MDIKKPEKKGEIGEEKVQPEVVEQFQEGKELKEVVGSNELTSDKELRADIEKMDLSDSLKMQASNQAQQMKVLQDEEKLKKLLEAAKEKGVIYAVNVAKKMDPYLLDSLHDLLAKEGYYKNFLK